MHDPRPATLQHLAAIEQCARQSFQPYIARIGRPPAPMVADFRSHIENCQIYVLDDAQEGFCGYIVLHPRDDHLFLENIAVAPEKQGKGFGRQLIGFAEHMARQSGLVAIRLYTNIHMHENLGLYRALGFVETHRRREDGFHRVYFEKQLT